MIQRLRVWLVMLHGGDLIGCGLVGGGLVGGGLVGGGLVGGGSWSPRPLFKTVCATA